MGVPLRSCTKAEGKHRKCEWYHSMGTKMRWNTSIYLSSSWCGGLVLQPSWQLCHRGLDPQNCDPKWALLSVGCSHEGFFPATRKVTHRKELLLRSRAIVVMKLITWPGLPEDYERVWKINVENPRMLHLELSRSFRQQFGWPEHQEKCGAWRLTSWGFRGKPGL